MPGDPQRHGCGSARGADLGWKVEKVGTLGLCHGGRLGGHIGRSQPTSERAGDTRPQAEMPETGGIVPATHLHRAKGTA